MVCLGGAETLRAAVNFRQHNLNLTKVAFEVKGHGQITFKSNHCQFIRHNT